MAFDRLPLVFVVTTAMVLLIGCAHRPGNGVDAPSSQPAAAVPEIDIGYVDLQRALMTLKEGRAEHNRLNALQGVTPEERAAEEKKALHAVFLKMDPLVLAIGKAHHLRLVLERIDSGVLWGAAGLDFTDELVARYEGGVIETTVRPQDASRAKVCAAWQKDTSNGVLSAPVEFLFVQTASGLVFASKDARLEHMSECPQPAATNAVGVADLTRLNRTFEWKTREAIIAAAARVAERHHLQLLLLRSKLLGVAAGVPDFTDELLAELRP